MAAPLTFGVRSLACFTCQIAKKPNIFIRQAFSPNCGHTRTYMKDVKKFYKNATIATADGWYEINLDKRKLRTPAGTLFRVPNEALALAVATEWNAQEKLVKRHEMHLTNLCNTALDNPLRKSRKGLTDDIVSVLETDTMFYRVQEPEELRLMLSDGWDPILQWANERYNLTLEFTYGLVMPHIPDGEKEIIRRHLLSYSDWALFGYAEAITTARSLLLVMALIDGHISVEKAVELAQLESIFQAKQWGIVEWHHEMDKYDLRTRLAAATLFIHWCSEDSSVIQKATLIDL